ncbi:dihydropteroate synthase [Butyricimonas muris]|uniref:dihydropteroate synthase n=1 Tax=Butyricimonas muris TaxID=3378067 RepID=UPI00396785C0
MMEIVLGDKKVSLERPVVMGILNVTPDSFYDGGKYLSEIGVIKRIDEIVEQGAGIIDVGAYSTRPGAAFVSEEEELSRLSFAVELVRKYHPEVSVSIDTFRSGVAKEINHCLGPVIVNDISGGTMDDRMFETVAGMGVPYILMHIQGTPQDMQVNPRYDDVVREVGEFFTERIARLNALGFNNIILDQGFGFGKTVAHNYQLMDKMESFLDFGYPLLVGISRKTMIWRLLDITPKEALNGTTVLNTISLIKGAHILRVHDVREAVEAVKIVEAMRG